LDLDQIGWGIFAVLPREAGIPAIHGREKKRPAWPGVCISYVCGRSYLVHSLPRAPWLPAALAAASVM